jgi:hypothetical protein
VTVKKVSFIFISIFAVFALSACSVFYPNAGAVNSTIESENPSPSSSESVEPSPSASPSSTSRKSAAEPVVLFYDVFSSTILIVGEVVNVSENNGECIITFYFANSPVLVERVSAESNVSTTQCAPLEVQLSDLPKGSGYAVISYESEKYEGQSEQFEVRIP